MHETVSPFANPALTVALALAAGMLAQSLARHLGIPGIVFLLGAGVVLGPDLLDLVRPETLGDALPTLIGFAVAVVLFEGGLNLNLARLRREARSIRQLVTLGALVTALGGAAAARLLLGWDWSPALLFGTLVIVTGPTVVNPLLRRIRVQRKVATVLEAEGVLIDAVGAIVAVVALELALRPGGSSLLLAPWAVLSRLGFGALLGGLGGLAIAALLRVDHLVPEGLENVFTLALVMLIFQASNAVYGESGIMATAVAGIVVGNVRTPALDDLKEFKEQLTVLFIGMLFVLLAADVRLAEVTALGWRGLATVAALMLVVRPLNVLVGTWGSDLTVREKALLAWLAPRGIVAAAVGSLFAQSLSDAGIAGGHELRAMVFLVIAVTVVVQGLTGGFVTRLLGLRRPADSGYAILGAGPLGRALGSLLRDLGEDVVLLDSSPQACRLAEGQGLRVLQGSALRESVLRRADLDSRAGCLALTSNDEVNLAFSRTVRSEYKLRRIWLALRRGNTSVTPQMVLREGGRVLFGRPRSLDLWSMRLERQLTRLEVWRRQGGGGSRLLDDGDQLVLPLAVRQRGKLRFVDQQLALQGGEQLYAVVSDERSTEAHEWLRADGWAPDEAPAPGVPAPPS